MSDIPPTSGPTPGSTPPPEGAPRVPLDYSSVLGPGFNWPDFLAFRQMIAVPVIKILFWIGVVWSVVMGLFYIVAGTHVFGSFFGGLCIGVSTMVVGPFLVRIYCEFLIVVFRINETLTEIKNELQKR